ncbi:MAG: M15 family metallopeptidase [Christensenellaceae bacterium]|nr:M15 family metallopeptidase [Christensenellaceae bacterium]
MTGNKKNKTNKSLRIMLILLGVFLIITAGAMLVSNMMNSGQDNWVKSQNEKIAAENQKLEEDYALLKSEYQKNVMEEENKSWPVPAQEGWDIVNLSGYPLENPQTMTVSRAELLKSGLMLINPWHPLPGDYETLTMDSLVSIGSTSQGKIAVQDYNLKLFPVAVDALSAVINDAAQEGLGDYIIREAFRSNAEQSIIFEKYRTELSNKYSGDILIDETKKKVNYPGTSEYQSGLSFQVFLYNSKDPSIAKQAFQETKQGKFFTENSWKYGFVFRFPTEDFPDSSWMDKSFLTGVSIKLNTYRYVGIPSATVMHLKNFVLEEYIDYLISNPHIAVYNNGILMYEIYRTEASPEGLATGVETIEVPASASNVVSSYDNMGGIITVITH